MYFLVLTICLAIAVQCKDIIITDPMEFDTCMSVGQANVITFAQVYEGGGIVTGFHCIQLMHSQR